MILFDLEFHLSQKSNMKFPAWVCIFVLVSPFWLQAQDSVDELWAKAKNHDADSAYRLGLMYYTGDRVKKDYQVAKVCFEAAKKYGKDPQLPDAFIQEIGKNGGLTNITVDVSLSADQQKKDRLAMDLVVKQYNDATIEATKSMAVLMRDPIKVGISSAESDVYKTYEEKLRAIDIGDCPADFRIAFVKFYQSVNDCKRYADSTTGLRGMAKGFKKGLDGLFSGTRAIVEAPDDTDKAMQSFREAGKELELVCTKYGIGIK